MRRDEDGRAPSARLPRRMRWPSACAEERATRPLPIRCHSENFEAANDPRVMPNAAFAEKDPEHRGPRAVRGKQAIVAAGDAVELREPCAGNAHEVVVLIVIAHVE